jgi:hypothetical protein
MSLLIFRRSLEGKTSCRDVYSPVNCYWHSPAQAFFISGPDGSDYHIFVLFIRSLADHVGSNPTQGMDVLYVYSLCLLGSGLATADPPSKESYRLYIGL